MPRKRGNGDGTIYKMESKGLWAAQLTIGVDANGKPKRKTIYGKRQADVRAKLDALKLSRTRSPLPSISYRLSRQTGR